MTHGFRGFKGFNVTPFDRPLTSLDKLLKSCLNLDNLKSVYQSHNHLPSCRFRWHRGDLIYTYKLFHNMLDMDNSSLFTTFITRGHNYKIYKSHITFLPCCHFFPIRIVNDWNELPYDLIQSIYWTHTRIDFIMILNVLLYNYFWIVVRLAMCRSGFYRLCLLTCTP